MGHGYIPAKTAILTHLSSDGTLNTIYGYTSSKQDEAVFYGITAYQDYLYAVSAYEEETDIYSALLAKLGTDGTIEWSIGMACPNYGFNCYGLDIAVDSQGNIYVVGYQELPDFPLGFIAKFDASGQPLWFLYQYSEDVYGSVLTDIDIDPSTGDVYVVGTHTPGQSPSYYGDAVIIKLRVIEALLGLR